MFSVTRNDRTLLVSTFAFTHQVLLVISRSDCCVLCESHKEVDARYCNHDVGHAIGAATIAAQSLGWNSCLLDSFDGEELDLLFGLPQTRIRTDRGPTRGVLHELEHEHADCLMAIFPSGELVNDKEFELALHHLRSSEEWRLRFFNIVCKFCNAA